MGPMTSVARADDGAMYALVAQYMWPFNCSAGASSLCLATRDPLRNSEGAAHTKRNQATASTWTCSHTSWPSSPLASCACISSVYTPGARNMASRV